MAALGAFAHGGVNHGHPGPGTGTETETKAQHPFTGLKSGIPTDEIDGVQLSINIALLEECSEEIIRF